MTEVNKWVKEMEERESLMLDIEGEGAGKDYAENGWKGKTEAHDQTAKNYKDDMERCGAR